MKVLLSILAIAFSLNLAAADNLQRVDAVPDDVESMKVVIQIYSQKVAFNMPTSWAPSFRDNKPDTFTIRFTPKDENIDSWTNKFTVQGFKNRSGKLPPEKFLTDVATWFKSVCEKNIVYESLGASTIDGHNAFSAIIGCPKLSNEDSSEVGYYVAIQGKNDLYVIRKFVRSAAFEPGESPIERSNADNFISSFMPIELCKKGGHPAECNK